MNLLDSGCLGHDFLDLVGTLGKRVIFLWSNWGFS